MKKIGLMMILCLGLVVLPTQKSHAIVWVVVKAALVKVIKAMDLAVQRLQNRTIWLQNAQKALENTLSRVKLDEISGWVGKQKEQYAKYYDELVKVKTAISRYRKVREIIAKQVGLVEEYRRALGLFKQDTHFSPEEISNMTRVYSGIVDESLKNLDQLFLVIRNLDTKMTDGRRLEIISRAADNMDATLSDLRSFNAQNAKLSLQRARDLKDAQTVKAIYGLQ